MKNIIAILCILLLSSTVYALGLNTLNATTGNLTLAANSNYIFALRSIGVTGDVNATGVICDSIGCIGVSESTIDASNITTGTLANARYNTSYVLIFKSNITIDGMNSSGTVLITDEHGKQINLGNMLTGIQEMETNTLLDKSRSTLSCVDGVLNYSLVALYGAGEWNFNGTRIGPAVGSANVTLTCGTDAVPVINYVNFRLAAGVPTLYADTSEPTDPNSIEVATFIVGACSGSSYTIYGYNRNRYEVDSFVNRVLYRYEYAGTLYISGFNILSSATDINITTGEYIINIFPMLTGNNLTMKGGFTFINGSGQYVSATALTALNQYADGSAVAANERVNIVWGIVGINTTGGTGGIEGRLVAILPTKPTVAYNSDAEARTDLYETTNYYPPSDELKKVFVPVARTIVRPSTGLFISFNSGIFYKDIRGKITSGGGSGAQPSGYVPYTGAVDNVLLGNFNITAANYIKDGVRLLLPIENNLSALKDVTVNFTYWRLNTLNRSGTLTDGKWCKYTSATGLVDCNVDPVVGAASQPNIDWANITTGTAPKLLGDWANMSGVFTVKPLADWSNLSGVFTVKPLVDWSNISGTAPKLLGDWSNMSGTFTIQPSIDGANVTSGTVPAARIPWIQPNIAWENITSGTAPKLLGDWSNMSGTFTVKPSVDWTNISGTAPKLETDWSNLTGTAPKLLGDWSNMSGTFAVQPSIDGANVTSGTVIYARLGIPTCGVGEFLNATGSELVCQADAGGAGDIEGVTAGNGLTGGGTSGTVILAAGSITGENITAGTVPAARIPWIQPSISWANITSGTAPYLLGDWANMSGTFTVKPSIDGANITAGTIAAARIPWIQPSISWANITTGTAPKLLGDWSNMSGTFTVKPSIDGANVTSGTIAGARMETLGDLATTAPITGAANDIFPGATGAKATIGITVSKDLVAGNGMTGGADDVFPGSDADVILAVGSVTWANVTGTRATDIVTTALINVTTNGQKVYVGAGGGFVSGNASAIWMAFP